jgi:hypothetical protein
MPKGWQEWRARIRDMLGLLPGETENQSAPAAAPASTLYSFKYHEW